MEFNIVINQVRALEWGLNFQLAGLFSYLHALPSWARSTVIGGETFYQVRPEKVIKDLPLLTDKKDTIYRNIRKLQDVGLVHLEIVDKVYFIRISSVGNLWNKTEFDAEQEVQNTNSAEKNPSFDGKKSAKPRKKIRQTAEKNPCNSSLYTNNPNTNTHTSSKKKPSPKFSTEDLRLADWFFQSLLAVDKQFKKPNLEKWADDIRLMRQCDGRDHKTMAAVWKFARGDPFWQANVLCPKTLRKQFDRLRAKMRSQSHAANQPNVIPRESDLERAMRQAQEIHADAFASEYCE